MIVGLFLVIIGALWILSNLGIISVNVAEFIWPIIIITIGLQILLGGRHFGGEIKPKKD